MNSLVSQFLFLVQVSRPIIWPVLPLVYALGMHAAHAHLTGPAIGQLLMLTFPMSLVGCGLNDIYDYESDRHSSRRRAIWGTVVTPTERPLVFSACVAMIPLVIFSACLTRNRDNFMATVSLVVMAWIYSVPPYRLKERPPLDSLANGLGYFLLPLMMGYSLNANYQDMPPRYFLLALCVAGIHALATAADYDADRAARHRTLSVAFGKRTAAAFAFVTFAFTCWYGDFGSVAIRTYLGVCAAAAFVAMLVPRVPIITGACVTTFVGFVLAAVCYLAGM